MPPIKIPRRLLLPRLTDWLVLAGVLLLVMLLVSPAQIPVAFYKLSLVSLAAVAAYWLDRALFPYARPDSYLQHDWRTGASVGEEQHCVRDGCEWVFAAAMLRRALIVLAVVLGVSLGL